MDHKRHLWPLVLAGTAAGHAAGYQVAAGSDAHGLLAATGHHYLGIAAVASLAAGVAGLAVAVAHRLREPSGSWISTAMWLCLRQTALFIGVEFVERLAVRAPLLGLAGDVVVAGLLAQVVVAFVAALIVVVLARAVDAIMPSARAHPEPRAQSFHLELHHTPRLVLTGAGGTRSPPMS